jgi:hypothetical protein
MNILARVGVLVLVIFGIAVGASAQDITAEVKTWSGQTVSLSQPTLEVFYTLLPRAREVPGVASGEGGALPDTGVPGPYLGNPLPSEGVPQPFTGSLPGGGYTDTPVVSGSMQQLSGFFRRGGGGATELVTAQGRRQRDTISLFRGATEIRVPVANLATLTFTRKRLTDPAGEFLPYWGVEQFRYGAVAVLTDGSKVEGDYVNLGTTLFRGTTPQGRVDVSWDDIQVVRFIR